MSNSISRLVDSNDPRISRTDFREIPPVDGAGAVTLVGVVHEHPASVHRVSETVKAVDPDVLALELPPLAIPLFRRYANEHAEPNAKGPVEASDTRTTDGSLPNGGEMSAAIHASDGSDVVGIDLPNRRHIGTIRRSFRAESLSIREATHATKVFGRQLAHATYCRIAEWGARLGVELQPNFRSVGSECDPNATPSEQAKTEASAVSAGTTLLRAFNRPPPIRVFDGARETAMAAELRDLRSAGSIVAVVGHAHLDAVAEALETDA